VGDARPRVRDGHEDLGTLAGYLHADGRVRVRVLGCIRAEIHEDLLQADRVTPNVGAAVGDLEARSNALR
jgi:hypothetical protein